MRNVSRQQRSRSVKQRTQKHLQEHTTAVLALIGDNLNWQEPRLSAVEKVIVNIKEHIKTEVK